MGKYRVLIKRSAAKELESVPSKKDRQRIVRRIRSLSEDPRPPSARKLSGRELYRIRQGNYRIVYEIRDEEVIVNVVKVGDRKDVYRT